MKYYSYNSRKCEEMQIPKLAIVVPCYNEELCVESTCKRLLEVLKYLIDKQKITSESYLYFVDDGSSDTTWQIIERLHTENNLVKGQKFLKNFGNQKAILAGLEAVHKNGCDCVVSIDADLQQDEMAIEKFLDEYQKGYDIVLGIRNNRKTDSIFKKTTAILFYKTMNILGAKIPMNHSDFRLVSDKALKMLSLYHEKALFLRGVFHELGLKTTTVNFDVKPRFAGASKFNFMSLMALALNGITSFSIVPLRIVACLGFLMAFFSFIIGTETICEKIFLNNSPNGFATLIIMLCFFGGIQIFCLGVIGEYVGQVYREVKARPRYVTEIELL